MTSPGHSPLLEFDPSRSAVIEPTEAISLFAVPQAFVICFFRDAIERFREETGAIEIGHLASEMGRHPVLEVDWGGTRVGLALGGVGAPLAAGWLEELIAMGGASRRGGRWGGRPGPESHARSRRRAHRPVRDEGASHHYMPAARLVEPTAEAVDAITRTLERNGVPFVAGTTWTTDALYRETRGKVAQRVAEGCLTVEMEAAALFAVARFRGISLGEILYAGDDLSGEKWDGRAWNHHVSGRDLLLRLAIEAAAGIEEGALLDRP